MFTIDWGWELSLGTNCFFCENEQNYQKQSHNFKKERNKYNPFLKILERLLKERTRNQWKLLEKNIKIRNAFLSPGMRSKSKIYIRNKQGCTRGPEGGGAH